MTIYCDQCKETGKLQYKSFIPEGETSPVTICYDCLGLGIPMGKTQNQLLEHISTPYWLHMGLKPNKSEQAQLKWLKDHNMTWGDLRKAKSLTAKNPGAYKDFQAHVKKYGAKSSPTPKYKKSTKS